MVLIGAGVGACTNEKSAFCASSHEFEKIGGALASMAQYLFPSLDLPLLMYIIPQGAN